MWVLARNLALAVWVGVPGVACTANPTLDPAQVKDTPVETAVPMPHGKDQQVRGDVLPDAAPDAGWGQATMGDRDGWTLSFRRREGDAWVTQEGGGATTWDEDTFVGHRWTPRGGVLLARGDRGVARFERLGGEHPAPAPMLFGAGVLADAFESAGGTVFLFVLSGDLGASSSVDILRSCTPGGVRGCERRGGFTLPRVGDARYYLGEMASRDRRGMSAAIYVDRDASKRTIEDRYIVHHEADGWTIEAVPGNLAIRQMLAAPDGGLWLVLGEQQQSLWHRGGGAWSAVDLPADLVGSEKIQVALRDDSEVWVAGNVGEHHAIHATPASLRSAAKAAVEPPGPDL